MKKMFIVLLGCLLCACAAPAKKDVAKAEQKASQPGSISGVIMLDATSPMSEGKLVVFHQDSGPPPFPSRYLRPPDETADINPDGSFNISLPAGRYYLTAINKQKDNMIGPPVEGDYVFPGPASLQSGQTIYTVTDGETTNIGTVMAVRFSKDDLAAYDDITSISGRIFGPNGEPVEGAIAFAFTSPNVVGKPLFISERSDSDGRYELRVNEGGSYFVKTRSHLRGGHPVEGELIGVYGAPLPKKLEIKTGEHLKDIDMYTQSFVNYRKDPEKAKYKPEGALE